MHSNNSNSLRQVCIRIELSIASVIAATNLFLLHQHNCHILCSQPELRHNNLQKSCTKLLAIHTLNFCIQPYGCMTSACKQGSFWSHCTQCHAQTPFSPQGKGSVTVDHFLGCAECVVSILSAMSYKCCKLVKQCYIMSYKCCKLVKQCYIM